MLKEILKQNVSFKHYRNGSLFYQTDDEKFIFEVPCEDLGNASVKSKERAFIFMKWIKEALKGYEHSPSDEEIERQKR